MSWSICILESMTEQMIHVGGEGEARKRGESEASANSMLPPGSVLVALCLHGAHILSGEVLSSLVWPDLFTL